MQNIWHIRLYLCLEIQPTWIMNGLERQHRNKFNRLLLTLKAPGPNRVHVIFYQKCWHVISKNIYCMRLGFLKDGLLSGLSKMHMTIIPKRDNPEKVTDYRQISLCNPSYKFISKVLANRLSMYSLNLSLPFKVLLCQIEIFMITY